MNGCRFKMVVDDKKLFKNDNYQIANDLLNDFYFVQFFFKQIPAVLYVLQKKMLMNFINKVKFCYKKL